MDLREIRHSNRFANRFGTPFSNIILMSIIHYYILIFYTCIIQIIYKLITTIHIQLYNNTMDHDIKHCSKQNIFATEIYFTS